MSLAVDSSIAPARLVEDKRTAAADTCLAGTTVAAPRPPAS